MKLRSFFQVLPGALFSILAATTAALRFYDADDLRHLLHLPHTLRETSTWIFLATVLVGLVDLSFKWNLEYRSRYREAAERAREAAERARETASTQLQNSRDIAILQYLIEPTDQNREVLRQVLQALQELDR